MEFKCDLTGGAWDIGIGIFGVCLKFPTEQKEGKRERKKEIGFVHLRNEIYIMDLGFHPR